MRRAPLLKAGGKIIRYFTLEFCRSFCFFTTGEISLKREDRKQPPKQCCLKGATQYTHLPPTHRCSLNLELHIKDCFVVKEILFLKQT